MKYSFCPISQTLAMACDTLSMEIILASNNKIQFFFFNKSNINTGQCEKLVYLATSKTLEVGQCGLLPPCANLPQGQIAGSRRISKGFLRCHPSLATGQIFKLLSIFFKANLNLCPQILKTQNWQNLITKPRTVSMVVSHHQ